MGSENCVTMLRKHFFFMPRAVMHARAGEHAHHSLTPSTHTTVHSRLSVDRALNERSANDKAEPNQGPRMTAALPASTANHGVRIRRYGPQSASTCSAGRIGRSDCFNYRAAVTSPALCGRRCRTLWRRLQWAPRACADGRS